MRTASPVVSLWQPAPARPLLAAGEVQLWHFPLVVSPEELVTLRGLLSFDEIVRAERLLDRRKAQAFIIARGRLRSILSRYLHCPPAALLFSYNSSGKPDLGFPPGSELAFNLSHAGEQALLAVTCGAKIGVDLEVIDPRLDHQRLASRFFARDEVRQLQVCPPHRRLRTFYRLWTRKEALLKGAGTGFTVPCDQIAPLAPPGWILCSFPVARGYLGALAIAGEFSLLRRWRLVL